MKIICQTFSEIGVFGSLNIKHIAIGGQVRSALTWPQAHRELSSLSQTVLVSGATARETVGILGLAYCNVNASLHN